MIRWRPIVPLFFALLCFGGCSYGLFGLSKELVYEQSVPLTPGTTTLQSPVLNLAPHAMYTLDVLHWGDFPVGAQAVLTASLQDENDATLFELEDGYWRETGTWYEEGQSGTWDESNNRTTFNFRVPEAHRYQIEVALEGGASLDPSGFLRLELRQSAPPPVSYMPFGLGAVVFLVAAWRVAWRRQGVTRELLEDMGAGSRLRVRGQEYTVSDVRRHVCDGDTGHEFCLRDAHGADHYLALDTLEREWEDSEGNDHTTTFPYILWQMPLEDREEDALEALPAGVRSVALRGVNFQYDDNNSGWGRMETYAEGERYDARYNAHVYIPGNYPSPTDAGQYILERTQFESGDAEWSLMAVLHWTEIEVLHFQPYQHDSAAPPAHGEERASA